jgi:hypothetical protein
MLSCSTSPFFFILACVSGARHFVHIFTPFCWNQTFCQNSIVIHKNIDGNMKLRYSLIIIGHQIAEKTSNFNQKWGWKMHFCGVHMDNFLSLLTIFSLQSPPNSPFHLTLCQNVMLLHETIDGKVQFDHNWQSNWWKKVKFSQNMRLKGKFGRAVMDKILSKCTPPDLPFHLTLCQNVMFVRQTIDGNIKPSNWWKNIKF